MKDRSFEKISETTKPAPKWVYVGQEYTEGLASVRWDGHIRPADFTDAEREAFVEKYPDLAVWWEKV